MYWEESACYVGLARSGYDESRWELDQEGV